MAIDQLTHAPDDEGAWVYPEGGDGPAMGVARMTDPEAIDLLALLIEEGYTIRHILHMAEKATAQVHAKGTA